MIPESKVRQLRESAVSASKKAYSPYSQAQVGSALQILWTATEDDVPEVRYNAIIALGRLRSRDSRSRLQALVEDRDPAVSYYAQWALLQLGQG